jgi:hypothetical protein
MGRSAGTGPNSGKKKPRQLLGALVHLAFDRPMAVVEEQAVFGRNRIRRSGPAQCGPQFIFGQQRHF